MVFVYSHLPPDSRLLNSTMKKSLWVVQVRAYKCKKNSAVFAIDVQACKVIHYARDEPLPSNATVRALQGEKAMCVCVSWVIKYRSAFNSGD